MSGFGYCSQSKGFWDRDFLLGTVSICDPRKAPTKFYPNPQFPSVFLALVFFWGESGPLLWLRRFEPQKWTTLSRIQKMRKMENALRAKAFEIETSCLVQCLYVNQRRPPPSFIQIRSFLLSFWHLCFFEVRVVHFCGSGGLSHKSGPHLAEFRKWEKWRMLSEPRHLR